MRKRTEKQNRIIHGLKRIVGISDENYRAAILAISESRTDSSADLTVAEANELIAKLGGEPPAKATRKGGKSRNVVKLATTPQRKKLYAMAVNRWGAEQAGATLEKFTRRQIGKARPYTSNEAKRLIDTIKAMNKHDQLKAAA